MYTYKSVYIYIYIYTHTQWYTRIENIYITTGWTLTCDSDRQTDTHAHATNSLNSHRRLQRGRSPMLARPRRTSISYLRLVKIFEPWSQNPLRDVDRVYVWCLCVCVCVFVRVSFPRSKMFAIQNIVHYRNINIYDRDYMYVSWNCV